MVEQCRACKQFTLLLAMRYGFEQCQLGNDLDTAKKNFSELLEEN